MSAAAWAGIVVAELERSVAWYCSALPCTLTERDARWAKLAFPNGTAIELFEGDRDDVAATFPSYGKDVGPPVMPGFGVDDPAGLAEEQGLAVARVLPGWVVVVAPDRLRVVLLAADRGSGRGLVGFRHVTTDGAAQRDFLSRLGVEGPEVTDGEIAVVPVVRGSQDALLTDPDGTSIAMVRSRRTATAS